jgi:septin family protein
LFIHIHNEETNEMAALLQQKVLLIGPKGIGKTRAVQELLHPQENDASMKVDIPNSVKDKIPLSHLASLGMATPSTIDWKYFHTLGLELDPIVLQRNGVPMQFNVWDIAGGQDPQIYANNVDFYIIFATEETEAMYIGQCGEVPYRVIRQRNELHNALVQ